MKKFIKAYRTKQRLLSELWDSYQIHEAKVAYYAKLFMEEENRIKAMQYADEMETEARLAAEALAAVQSAKKVKLKLFF